MKQAVRDSGVATIPRGEEGLRQKGGYLQQDGVKSKRIVRPPASKRSRFSLASALSRPAALLKSRWQGANGAVSRETARGQNLFSCIYKKWRNSSTRDTPTMSVRQAKAMRAAGKNIFWKIDKHNDSPHKDAAMSSDRGYTPS